MAMPPYPYGYGNYWGPPPPDCSDDENFGPDESEESETEDIASIADPEQPGSGIICQPKPSTAAASPSAPGTGVSLAAHVAAITTEEDVGPKVGEDLAKLAELIWSKPQKEDIRDLYTTDKRPQNTPSLQKVQLDDDICAGLADKSKARRSDAVFASINTARTKPAVCLTSPIEVNQKDADQPGISQRSADHAVNGLKILSYATHLLHQVRRDQLKYVLDPAIRQKLGKNKSLSEINESHQLFGGDTQKQAKEG